MLAETENNCELVCRACEKHSAKSDRMIDLHSLDTNSAEFQSISDLFTKYTFLKIDENDGISSHICTECHTQLVSFHKFREMCLATYYKLIKQKCLITNCLVPLAPVLNIKQEDPLEVISFENYVEDSKIRTKTEMVDAFSNYENNANDLHEIYFSENNCSDSEMEENKFKCEICSRNFCERNYVRKHMRDVHHIDKQNDNYKCLLCTGSFALSKLDTLRKHVMTHGKIVHLIFHKKI